MLVKWYINGKKVYNFSFAMVNFRSWKRSIAPNVSRRSTLKVVW